MKLDYRQGERVRSNKDIAREGTVRVRAGTRGTVNADSPRTRVSMQVAFQGDERDYRVVAKADVDPA